jgi:hypothetical protein
LPERRFDRPRAPAVTAEVPEVGLVQGLRVPKGQLAVAERDDEEGRRVGGDAGELLFGAVEVANSAAVVVLMVRRDHPFRQSVEGSWSERQRNERVIARESGGNGHERAS